MGVKNEYQIYQLFIVVFFIVIGAVSAANENITNEDSLLAIDNGYENLAVSNDENVSLSSVSDDSLSVSKNENASLISVAADENVSLASVNEESLSISKYENVSVISVSNDNCVSLSIGSDLPVAVSVDSKLSATNDQPKLSVQISQEDSKLADIYNRVYSTKDWKTVGVCIIKYKYTWSKYKINQVNKKRLNSKKSTIKRITIKYLKKGWHFDRVYYTIDYGRKVATAKFYLQFYKTIYYNGYGEILYIC